MMRDANDDDIWDDAESSEDAEYLNEFFKMMREIPLYSEPKFNAAMIDKKCVLPAALEGLNQGILGAMNAPKRPMTDVPERILDLMLGRKFMGTHDKNITTQVVINCPNCGGNSFTRYVYTKTCNHCKTEIDMPAPTEMVAPINFQAIKVPIRAKAGDKGPYVAGGPGQPVAVDLYVENSEDQNKILVGMDCVTEDYVEARVMMISNGFVYFRPKDPTITMCIRSGAILTF